MFVLIGEEADGADSDESTHTNTQEQEEEEEDDDVKDPPYRQPDSEAVRQEEAMDEEDDDTESIVKPSQPKPAPAAKRGGRRMTTRNRRGAIKRD